MLSVERLRVLHAIASYGSVHAAAAALQVTTSAVSQQMAKLELELELGQRLLDRKGRGIQLTDAAARLVQHADRIMSVVAEAEADLEAHRGAVVGTLTIAAFASAARGLVPQALVALRASHPQVAASLSVVDPDDCVALIARGDLDLLIALDWDNAPLAIAGSLIKAPLLDDLVDVALPADHPLADRAEIALRDVAHEPWISWHRGSMCHDWLLLTLRNQGVEPRIAHNADDLATQLALVAAGLGICVIPRLGRGTVPAEVRIVPVRPTLQRHVHAIWRADAARRPVIRAAVQALRNAAAQLQTQHAGSIDAITIRPTTRPRTARSRRARHATTTRGTR